MEIFVTFMGKFPRSENLIRTTRDFDRGRVSPQELKNAYEKDYQSVKNLQTGFKWVSDGLLNWQDILRPFAEIVQDTKVGGLVRYYETNTFIRKLYFSTDRLNDHNTWTKKYFRFGNLAILPGPLTFQKYTSGLSLSQIFNVLYHVAQTLKRAGYSVFYFQEPEIVYEPSIELPDSYKSFFNSLKNDLSESIIVINTYFGSVIPVIKQLFHLNIDGIGIDFFETNVLALKEIGWVKSKGILAGIVNTTNSLIETTDMINPLLEILVMEIQPKFLVLTGRADFELLPHKIAEKKVEFLKTLVDK